MASSARNTTGINTQAGTTDDRIMNIMSMQLPSDVRAYVSLTHLQPQEFMETRRESLFNQKSRVRIAETTTAPFDPITTSIMRSPNNQNKPAMIARN
jgi:hypothetical protein